MGSTAGTQPNAAFAWRGKPIGRPPLEQELRIERNDHLATLVPPLASGNKQPPSTMARSIHLVLYPAGERDAVSYRHRSGPSHPSQAGSGSKYRHRTSSGCELFRAALIVLHDQTHPSSAHVPPAHLHLPASNATIDARPRTGENTLEHRHIGAVEQMAAQHYGISAHDILEVLDEMVAQPGSRSGRSCATHFAGGRHCVGDALLLLCRATEQHVARPTQYDLTQLVASFDPCWPSLQCRLAETLRNSAPFHFATELIVRSHRPQPPELIDTRHAQVSVFARQRLLERARDQSARVPSGRRKPVQRSCAGCMLIEMNRLRVKHSREGQEIILLDPARAEPKQAAPLVHDHFRHACANLARRGHLHCRIGESDSESITDVDPSRRLDFG